MIPLKIRFFGLFIHSFFRFLHLATMYCYSVWERCSKARHARMWGSDVASPPLDINVPQFTALKPWVPHTVAIFLTACPTLLSQNPNILSCGAVCLRVFYAFMSAESECCDCGPAAESAMLSVSLSVCRSVCCLFCCVVFYSCSTAIRQVCCFGECVYMSSVSVFRQYQISDGESPLGTHTHTAHTV